MTLGRVHVHATYIHPQGHTQIYIHVHVFADTEHPQVHPHGHILTHRDTQYYIYTTP